MQALQIFLMVALGVTVTGAIATHAVGRDGGLIGGIGPKVLIGLGIGLMGALGVAALFGDVMPDAWEGVTVLALIVTISSILVGTFIRRWLER